MLSPRAPAAAGLGFARWLLPFMGLASLLGGSVFWLRRVGWLQPQTYWFSNTELIAQSGHDRLSPEAYEFVIRHHLTLHHLEGALVLTKYAKELVFAAFLLTALAQLPRLRAYLPSLLVLALLALVASCSAVIGLLGGQWLAFLAGARCFGSWVIAAFGTPFVDVFFRRACGRILAWVLVVQALIIPVELNRGMLIYHFNVLGIDFVRAVGTFNLPTSLGLFAVTAWAAALSWGDFGRRILNMLTLLLVFVLAACASATAWIALAAIGFILAFRRIGKTWRPWVLAAMLPLSVVAWTSLPVLTGRSEVHDSLWGRVAPVMQYAGKHLGMRETLFGIGFGVGTNALGSQSQPLKFDGSMPTQPVGDSTPAVLFWQFGLVGLSCAYALFAIGLLRDRRSQPIGIALLVATTSVSITEHFPLNLMLGFWLAHSAFRKEPDEPA